MNDSILVSDYHAGFADEVSEIMLKLRISRYIAHADTSNIKLVLGKKVNDTMVYPRHVKGKFKYYSENDDVI
jgi:hypothetical protein